MQKDNLRSQLVKVRCCIAGGGPAGMVLGFLLARSGVDVVVLEKHADFLRDFRGDTIHPSTLELMYELGILDEFLRRPHQELAELGAQIEEFVVTVADFSHLPTHCKFIALMPQWDFLNFIAEKGKLYPQFHLRMESEVTSLMEENGRVVGVRAATPQGVLEVRADLTVGADGRHSIVREKAGFEAIDLGAPIDVLWMRLARQPNDPYQTLGRFRAGKILVTLNRGDYWQCAYVIPKGAFDAIRLKGLPSFREDVASAAPFLRGRTGELKDWSDVKLLSVAVDRLRQWSRAGLLCIGDSAHAMSPIGGVGINLAIQDAVAAANVLAQPLLRDAVSAEQLREIQQRREYPTRMTQRFQVFAHKRLLGPALSNDTRIRRLPLPFKLLQRFPVLRRIPARMLGLGFRPEHVRTLDAKSNERALHS
jgi:2-polyprenyl-6-methoxyphenol hydroxylase-like FAD-dependent oxidoreductase